MSTPPATIARIAAIDVVDVGEAGRQVADERGPALGAGGREDLADAHRALPVAPAPSALVRLDDALGLRRDEVRARHQPEPPGGGVDVLVAAAGEVDQDDRVRAEPAALAERAGERVGALDRRDDALGAAEQRGRPSIASASVTGSYRRAAGVGEPGVLGADARVVEAGGDRVALDGLAVLVLQDEGAGAVEDAGQPAGDRRRVPAGLDAVAAGLEAEQLDGRRRR